MQLEGLLQSFDSVMGIGICLVLLKLVISLVCRQALFLFLGLFRSCLQHQLWGIQSRFQWSLYLRFLLSTVHPRVLAHVVGGGLGYEQLQQVQESSPEQPSCHVSVPSSVCDVSPSRSPSDPVDNHSDPDVVPDVSNFQEFLVWFSKVFHPDY